MKLSVVLLLVLTILFVGCKPNENPGADLIGELGQISGVVTDDEGTPRTGATVVAFSTDEENSVIRETVVDDDGYYIFEELPPFEYNVQAAYMEQSTYETQRLTIEAGEAITADFVLVPYADADDIARKPNIYLYPVEETEVSVKLDFAGEGYITTTIPDYGDGWTVTITPDGLIDDEYDFLFYEGVVDAEAQHTHGWLIVQEELESFFRVNLTAYGFRGQEIEDFIEFWVPRLTDKPMYVIYPQLNEDYDNLVALTVEPKPDHILRLAYTIRGVDIFDGRLLAPEMPTASFIVPQEREGFWVTEWGVLLAGEDVETYLR